MMGRTVMECCKFGICWSWKALLETIFEFVFECKINVSILTLKLEFNVNFLKFIWKKIQITHWAFPGYKT